MKQTHATSRMNLVSVIRPHIYDSNYKCKEFRIEKSTETESRIVIARGWGNRSGYRVSVGSMRTILEPESGDGHISPRIYLLLLNHTLLSG